MTIRLPQPGGDDGDWGDILNSFLAVSLNADGTYKRDGDITTAVNNAASAVSTANSASSAVAGKAAKGANSDITSLSGLTTPLTAAQGGTGNANGKAAVDVAQSGTVAGTRSKLNFIPSTNVTITTADNPGSGQVDVTISSSGTGSGLGDPTTTKGDIIVRSTGGVTREPVGVDGQVLTAASGQTTGLIWATPVKTVNSETPNASGNVSVTASDVGAVALSTFTTKGDLLVATGSGAVTRLAAGSTGNTYLKNDGSGNLSWSTVSGGGGSSTFTHVSITSTPAQPLANLAFALVDSSSGAITLTLPAVADGAWVRIKRLNAAGNGILIQGQGSTTIDGQANATLNTQYDSQDFMSDGTNWYFI